MQIYICLVVARADVNNASYRQPRDLAGWFSMTLASRVDSVSELRSYVGSIAETRFEEFHSKIVCRLQHPWDALGVVYDYVCLGSEWIITQEELKHKLASLAPDEIKGGTARFLGD